MKNDRAKEIEKLIKTNFEKLKNKPENDIQFGKMLGILEASRISKSISHEEFEKWLEEVLKIYKK